MPLLRNAVLTASVVLLVVACRDPEPAPVRDPSVSEADARPTPPRRGRDAPEPAGTSLPTAGRLDERLIPGDLNGWVPPDELIERAHELRDEKAFEAFRGLDEAEQVDLIRTGLRLADENLARALAFQAEWQYLDLWEARRAATLMVDAVFDPDWRDPTGEGDYGWGLSTLFEIAGRDALTRVLERLIELPADADGFYDLDSLHKLVHAGHAPLVARACLAPHPRVRDFARQTLLPQLVARTDRFRDHFAAALLGLTVEEARRRYPTVPDGLDPLLEAVLRSQHLEQDADATGWKPEHLWAWRWLAESTAAARDLPFLLDLGRATAADHAGGDVVSWLLRAFDDADSRALLEERAETNRSVTALAALTVRGDEDARLRLEERAADDAGALNILLAARPDLGREVVADALFGDEPPARDKMLALVEEAWIEGPALTGVSFDAGALAELEARAFVSGLPATVLAEIAVRVPGARTKRIARTAIARWDDTVAFSSLEDHTVPEPRSPRLAFLETAAPEAFRARILQFVASTEERERLFGLETLLRLGAHTEAEGGALVAWLDSMAPELLETRGILLERSRSAAVGEWLRARLEQGEGGQESLWPLAIAYAARSLSTGLRYGVDPADWPQYRRLLLAQRPRDALALVLERDTVVENVHRVPDPRVREYLERLRADRRRGLYAWATAELDLSSGNSICETVQVLDAHPYRWVDDLEGVQLLAGGKGIPDLFEPLESNCCAQIAIVSQVCEGLLGFEFPRGDDGAGETRAHLMWRLWKAAHGEHVWSELAEHYVPAAR